MFILKRRKAAVRALAFSPDGGRLAAMGPRDAIQVWDLASRSLALEVPRPHHLNESLTYTPDGAELLVRGQSEIEAYGPDGAALGRRTLPDAIVDQMAVSGGRLVVAYTGQLACLALPGYERLWAIAPGLPEGCFALAAQRDGPLVALGDAGGVVSIFDGSGPVPMVSYRVTEKQPLVRALAMTPDGRSLACCVGPSLHIVRQPEAECVAKHSLGRTHFNGAVAHPSGAYFATSNGDGKVDLWDARTGARRESFDWGVGKLFGVTFDAAGERAAACSATGEIVVWDIDR